MDFCKDVAYSDTFYKKNCFKELFNKTEASKSTFYKNRSFLVPFLPMDPSSKKVTTKNPMKGGFQGLLL